MKRTAYLQAFSPSKQIAFCALFAALCAVGTIVLVLPMPYGYFNAGDIFVLLSGWCLGPIFGAISAGVGSALADIWSGYAVYAPATFFIKAFDALTAYFVWRAFKKVFKKSRELPRLLSAFAGECVMAFGYFAFECILYGFAGACVALPANALQGLFGTVLATLLVALLCKNKSAQKLFPLLHE